MTYLRVLHFRLQSANVTFGNYWLPPQPKQCVTLTTLIWENLSICYAAENGHNFSLNHTNAAISSSCRGIFGNLSNLARKKKGPDAIPLYIYSISIEIERSFQCIDIFVAYFWTDWKCTFDAQEMHLSWLELPVVSNIVWNKPTGCKFISAREKLSQWEYIILPELPMSIFFNSLQILCQILGNKSSRCKFISPREKVPQWYHISELCELVQGFIYNM